MPPQGLVMWEHTDYHLRQFKKLNNINADFFISTLIKINTDGALKQVVIYSLI
jgi:hypothetical protein